MAHIHKLRIIQTILKTYMQRPDTHQTHTQWTQKTLRYPGIYTKDNYAGIKSSQAHVHKLTPTNTQNCIETN